MFLKFWRAGHTKHRLLYHLVWIPKYRRKVLDGKVAKVLQHLFYEAAKTNWWWIEEMQIMPDHVHLLIQLQPTDSVADAVQRLKGGTSRLLRKQFPELEEFEWSESFWCDGYFAETVGRNSYSRVKKYIQEQWASMPPVRS